MANVMKSGSDWLMSQLTSHVGTTVSIRRGGSVTSVTATVGSQTHETSDDLGGLIRWESRDYLIEAADYKFAGVASEPKRGDRIEETQGGVTRVHEVMGDVGSVPWRWSDDYRRKYRIHTKQVSLSS